MHTWFRMRKPGLPAKTFIEKPKQVERPAVWDVPYSHRSCCKAPSCWGMLEFPQLHHSNRPSLPENFSLPNARYEIKSNTVLFHFFLNLSPNHEKSAAVEFFNKVKISGISPFSGQNFWLRGMGFCSLLKLYSLKVDLFVFGSIGFVK